MYFMMISESRLLNTERNRGRCFYKHGGRLDTVDDNSTGIACGLQQGSADKRKVSPRRQRSYSCNDLSPPDTDRDVEDDEHHLISSNQPTQRKISVLQDRNIKITRGGMEGERSPTDRRQRWVQHKQKSRSFDFCWRSGMWSPVDDRTRGPLVVTSTPKLGTIKSCRLKIPPMFQMDSGSSYESYDAADVNQLPQLQQFDQRQIPAQQTVLQRQRELHQSCEVAVDKKFYDKRAKQRMMESWRSHSADSVVDGLNETQVIVSPPDILGTSDTRANERYCETVANKRLRLHQKRKSRSLDTYEVPDVDICRSNTYCRDVRPNDLPSNTSPVSSYTRPSGQHTERHGQDSRSERELDLTHQSRLSDRQQQLCMDDEYRPRHQNTRDAASDIMHIRAQVKKHVLQQQQFVGNRYVISKPQNTRVHDVRIEDDKKGSVVADKSRAGHVCVGGGKGTDHNHSHTRRQQFAHLKSFSYDVASSKEKLRTLNSDRKRSEPIVEMYHKDRKGGRLLPRLPVEISRLEQYDIQRVQNILETEESEIRQARIEAESNDSSRYSSCRRTEEQVNKRQNFADQKSFSYEVNDYFHSASSSQMRDYLDDTEIHELQYDHSKLNRLKITHTNGGDNVDSQHCLIRDNFAGRINKHRGFVNQKSLSYEIARKPKHPNVATVSSKTKNMRTNVSSGSSKGSVIVPAESSNYDNFVGDSSYREQASNTPCRICIENEEEYRGAHIYNEQQKSDANKRKPVRSEPIPGTSRSKEKGREAVLNHNFKEKPQAPVARPLVQNMTTSKIVDNQSYKPNRSEQPQPVNVFNTSFAQTHYRSDELQRQDRNHRTHVKDKEAPGVETQVRAREQLKAAKQNIVSSAVSVNPCERKKRVEFDMQQQQDKSILDQSTSEAVLEGSTRPIDREIEINKRTEGMRAYKRSATSGTPQDYIRLLDEMSANRIASISVAKEEEEGRIVSDGVVRWRRKPQPTGNVIAKNAAAWQEWRMNSFMINSSNGPIDVSKEIALTHTKVGRDRREAFSHQKSFSYDIATAAAVDLQTSSQGDVTGDRTTSNATSSSRNLGVDQYMSAKEKRSSLMKSKKSHSMDEYVQMQQEDQRITCNQHRYQQKRQQALPDQPDKQLQQQTAISISRNDQTHGEEFVYSDGQQSGMQAQTNKKLLQLHKMKAVNEYNADKDEVSVAEKTNKSKLPISKFWSKLLNKNSTISQK